MISAKPSCRTRFGQNPILNALAQLKTTPVKIKTALLLLMPLVLLLATSSSASFFKKANHAGTAADPLAGPSRTTETPFPGSRGVSNMLPMPSLLSMPAIATFDEDCTTPKTLFNVGDTVCVAVTGVPLSAFFPRRLTWATAESFIVQSTDIETDPRSDSLEIAATTLLPNGTAIDNRGTWTLVVRNPFFHFPEAQASFTVTDPANSSADIAVAPSLVDDEVQAGTEAAFGIQVNNYGPDASSNVVLTNLVPANTTFVSFQQLSGPTFNCTTPMEGSTGTIECSIAVLTADAVAQFVGIYAVNSGVGAGTEILNQASIVGLTPGNPDGTSDPNLRNNSSTGTTTVSAGGTGVNCTLDCPANVIVTADTTSGGEPGKFVTFAAAVVSGDCGAVTNNPASGSFFAVGTHTITSSAEIGGTSCFFTVTVLDSNPPTITCPANITVTAAEGATQATVNPGSPTITPVDGTVTFVRSDNIPAVLDDNGNVVTPAVIHALTDPFPIGTTGIQWTITDAGGRTASCNQAITVIEFEGRDPVTITCPGNVNVAAESGCATTIPAATIGTPTTVPSDSNIQVVATRSDGLSLSDPFPAGNTLITWTATDETADGTVLSSASCVQSVMVTAGSGADTTPPTLVVPANVNATTSSCTAILDDELGAAEAEDTGACGGSVTITRTGVPAGFAFPTGTTTITYTATDAAGNTSTGTQLVTVTESPAIPPTITAPADVTAFTGPDATSCGTVVTDATLGTAVANDNCAGVTVTRTGVPAGNIFPVGNTTVTYTATDRSGNTATDTQIVTVIDNTIPVVTPPAPVTLFTGPGATSCGVTVVDLDATLGTGSATDNCPGVGAVTRSGVPAGNVFPVGQTIVTYSVIDAHGNTDSETQTVTVVDNTKPVFTSTQPDIVLEPTCPSGAIATYAFPTATDNCGVQSIVLTAGLASGSVFPFGITTVTHTATDIHGNTETQSFTVTVLTPAAVVQNLINAVNALPGLTGQQRQGLLSKLTAALDAINEGKTNVACNKLNDFISQVQGYISNGTLTSAQGQPLINSAMNVRNTLGCTSLPCT